MAVRQLRTNPETVPASEIAKRYTDLSEALRELSYNLRRAKGEFEGASKLSSMENAGPMNADKRRKAYTALLKEYKAHAVEAFDTCIAGMA